MDSPLFATTFNRMLTWCFDVGTPTSWERSFSTRWLLMGRYCAEHRRVLRADRDVLVGGYKTATYGSIDVERFAETWTRYA